MQDTLVILNPAARSERAGHWRSRVEKVARGAALRSTSRIGEAESLARKAAREGYQRIVAAGGDGTINEVVNGLAGTSAALGLLPIGTVNVFATELGLPSGDLNQCWQIVCDGHTRTIDLPNANGKHFVQLAGIGLDAQAVRKPASPLNAALALLAILFRRRRSPPDRPHTS